MARSDRLAPHAFRTAPQRRTREAARRDERLRRLGHDPVSLDDTAPQPPRPRRRRVPLRRYLQLVALLLIVGLLVGGGLLWQRMASFNGAVSTASAASSALFGPLNGRDRVNVLMVGYAGEEKHGGAYLADSLNILSIDPVTNTTTIVPIPRDFWIEGLPELPDNGKVNEAFAIGWARGGVEEAGRATAQVLSETTGLRIDHWMAIDFAGFREMVDAVGGVTVENPRAFAYTWNETDFHAGRWNGGSFKKGTLHLNGTQALSYARSRYTSVPAESSDFARSIRQQRIMGALRTKLGAGGIGSLGPGLALMDALQGRLKTDLSAIDLALLSSHFNPDRRIELKEGVVLEATRNSGGQYILVVIGRSSPTDYTPLRRWLAEELARPIARASARPSGG